MSKPLASSLAARGPRRRRIRISRRTGFASAENTSTSVMSDQYVGLFRHVNKIRRDTQRPAIALVNLQNELRYGHDTRCREAMVRTTGDGLAIGRVRRGDGRSSRVDGR